MPPPLLCFAGSASHQSCSGRVRVAKLLCSPEKFHQPIPSRGRPQTLEFSGGSITVAANHQGVQDAGLQSLGKHGKRIGHLGIGRQFHVVDVELVAWDSGEDSRQVGVQERFAEIEKTQMPNLGDVGIPQAKFEVINRHESYFRTQTRIGATNAPELAAMHDVQCKHAKRYRRVEHGIGGVLANWHFSKSSIDVISGGNSSPMLSEWLATIQASSHASLAPGAGSRLACHGRNYGTHPRGCTVPLPSPSGYGWPTRGRQLCSPLSLFPQGLQMASAAATNASGNR